MGVYYKASPLEQVISPQILEANIARPRVRPRPTLRLELACRGPRSVTFRWRPSSATLPSAGPWGLAAWGWYPERPGRRFCSAARAPARRVPAFLCSGAGSGRCEARCAAHCGEEGGRARVGAAQRARGTAGRECGCARGVLGRGRAGGGWRDPGEAARRGPLPGGPAPCLPPGAPQAPLFRRLRCVSEWSALGSWNAKKTQENLQVPTRHRDGGGGSPAPMVVGGSPLEWLVGSMYALAHSFMRPEAGGEDGIS